jgi:2-polyprenyl-3-methyl-5-hydroxy-6-metoxy-1,4-benzoquinol methylase
VKIFVPNGRWFQPSANRPTYGDVGGLRLLEVACGPGRVARELARRGATLTGLDISAALLAKAQAREAAEPLGITYLHADVTAAGVLAGRVFDGVVCNYGLSDIDDLDGLLANVARWLNPGGWFVFSLLHPTGYRGRVGASHRMISTYLNSLTRHGLVLDRAAEPPAGPEMDRRRPPGAVPVPFYFAARCLRSPGPGQVTQQSEPPPAVTS